MGAGKTRGAAAAFSCTLVLIAVLTSSCTTREPPYRVAMIGFKDNQLAGERDSLAEYGQRRVEAELEAEVDFLKLSSGYNPEELFSTDGGAYDLVVSLGQNSSQDMLLARPEDTQVQDVALDFESSQPVPGESSVSLVR